MEALAHPPEAGGREVVLLWEWQGRIGRQRRKRAWAASLLLHALAIAYEAGVDYYITKPIKPTELVKKIREILNKQRGANGKD